MQLDDWVLCRIYKKNNSQRTIDKDDSMVASLPTSKFYYPYLDQKITQKSMNCDAILENDENFFDNLLTTTSEGINQFVTSSSLNPVFSTTTPPSSTQTLKLPTLPSSSYWPDTTGITMHQSAKKFHANNDSGNYNGNSNVNYTGNVEDERTDINTIVSLLNHLPQVNNPMHHQVLLGEGFLRQPYQNSGENWNP